jgi:hypothetical protein
VQRTPVDWDERPLRWKHFQICAKRFNKKKLLNPDGTFKDPDNSAVDGHRSLIGDAKFEDLFHEIDGAGAEALWAEHSRRVNDSTSAIRKIFKKHKSTFPACLDLKSGVGLQLIDAFGVPVYVVDQCWDPSTGEWWRPEKRTDNKYDRNLVFYQATACGGDAKLIGAEDNGGNDAVFLWAFEDRIVYKVAEGRGEW